MSFIKSSDTAHETAQSKGTYKSRLANSTFDSADEYTLESISFKAGSEHTIDDKRFDLEM